MAYAYEAAQQNVTLNQPVLFTDLIPCRNGNVFHSNGTGLFRLNGRTKCNCPNSTADYLITFVGNIAIPTGGAVGPIAVALSVDGNIIVDSRGIVTPTAVEEYNNVSISRIVSVPKMCGCESVSIIAVSGLVDDPAGTPAPVISLVDGNLLIARQA